MRSSKVKIIYTCGGTGGHIYPAIALAQELEKNTEALFIGSKDREDIHIVPKYGYKLESISSSNRNVLKIGLGFIQSVLILIRENPVLLISTGGYLTFPVVLAAWLLRVPVVILEQNAVIGRVNKWLSRLAVCCVLSFKSTVNSLPKRKVECLGNPVRKYFGKSKQSIEFISTINSERVLLVVGGSQGASAINRFIGETAEKWVESGWELIHITGRKNYDEWNAKSKGVSGWNVFSYIEDMATLYKRARVVLARAGATTISELIEFQKPGLLVPYPFAKDNHQVVNAEEFVRMGRGKWCAESKLEMAYVKKMVDQLDGLNLEPEVSAREKIAKKIRRLI